MKYYMQIEQMTIVNNNSDNMTENKRGRVNHFSKTKHTRFFLRPAGAGAKKTN